MSAQNLRNLLEHVDDTWELVLPGVGLAGDELVGELAAVWWAARAESNDAYEHWSRAGGADAYAAYRAAEDRADAAADGLAAATRPEVPATI
jgi:hypothetical protein